MAVLALSLSVNSFACDCFSKDFTKQEIEIIAKLIYGEARGIKSMTEKSGVAWCVLNRVDAGYANGTIKGVVTAKGQFAGYSSKNPVTTEHYNIAKDVLERWHDERTHGKTNVYRTLPKDYLYFSGSKGHNYFRKTYKSKTYWGWQWSTPYAS